MSVTVIVVEPLGGLMDIVAATSTGARLVARAPAESAVLTAQKLTFYINTPRIHLFRPGSHGVNLLLTDATRLAAMTA